MSAPAWSRRKLDYCPRDCPNRSGECHATCKEYAEKKAEHERRREEDWKKRNVDIGLNNQRARAFERSTKKAPHKF